LLCQNHSHSFLTDLHFAVVALAFNSYRVFLVSFLLFCPFILYLLNSQTSYIAADHHIMSAAHTSLKVAVKNATGTHSATVVFMHGLGDSSVGWSFLATHMKTLTHIKWIFPNAPVQPVTVNRGMACPSWYDIYALGSDAELPANRDRADEAGIMKSVATINNIVQQELDTTDIPSDRIVLGGFSQGSVIALITGLTSERKLAGVAALSGYLAMPSKIVSMTSDRGRQLPIFWGHGREDETVKYAWGEQSVAILKEKLKMKDVEFKTYEGMGHSADLAEMKDLQDWFEKVIPAATSSDSSSSTAQTQI